jgi:hypothetical protein
MYVRAPIDSQWLIRLWHLVSGQGVDDQSIPAICQIKSKVAGS